MLHFYQK